MLTVCYINKQPGKGYHYSDRNACGESAASKKNMEICYFSNFKAKSKLRKCTDSPEPSLIAEMRNNIEIHYFSIFEAQSSLRQE